MSSRTRIAGTAVVGLWLAALACFGGNQELMEQKSAELNSLNVQVATLVAPDGLKEGETVEVKAKVRVERAPDQGAVVRDVEVESVKIAGVAGVGAAGAVAPVAGVAVKPAADGAIGLRQEPLDVPAVKRTPAEELPGFRRESLSVPAVNKKREE